MRFNPLHLLLLVVGFELVLGGAVVISCLINKDRQCSEGKVNDLFNSITASSFAIYAAESARTKK